MVFRGTSISVPESLILVYVSLCSLMLSRISLWLRPPVHEAREESISEHLPRVKKAFQWVRKLETRNFPIKRKRLECAEKKIEANITLLLMERDTNTFCDVYHILVFC